MSDKSDINSAIKALKIEEKIKAKKEWLSSWQINFLITIFVWLGFAVFFAIKKDWGLSLLFISSSVIVSVIVLPLFFYFLKKQKKEIAKLEKELAKLKREQQD